MSNPIEHRTASAQAGLAVVLAIVSVVPAYAYVDPGTGSMLLQMGLAAVAGAVFYFRQWRIALADWFRRAILRQTSATAGSDAEPSRSDLVQ